MIDPNLQHVARGEEVSAALQNALIDAVGRDTTGDDVHDGPAGAFVAGANSIPIALFQVTTRPAYNETAKEWKGMGVPVVLLWGTINGKGHWIAQSLRGKDGSVERYRPMPGAMPETLVFPGAPHDSDTCESQLEAPWPHTVNLGDYVWCIKRYEFWEVLALVNIGLQPFELYDDITPGGMDKNAWPLKVDGTPNTDADKILVSDSILGDVRALGYATKDDDAATNGSKGAKGWYTQFGGKNAIVSIRRLAKLCKGATTTAVAKTDGTFTVDNVEPLDDGQSPVNATTDTITVSNWAKWEAKSGIECQFILLTATTGRFDQGPCKGDT